MKKAMRDHWYAYGRTRGVLFHSYSGGIKGPAGPSGLDCYCSDICGCSTSPCEHYQLFLGFLGRGSSASRAGLHADGSQTRFRILGVLPVSRGIRPPRDYNWVSAWRDGTEAKLHGEVFRRFIRGWLQTGVERHQE